MQARPVIGLITEIQEALAEPDSFALVTNRQYLRAITAAGATPRRVPLLQHDEPALRRVYEEIDGLFLTGGADVDPVYYNEPRHPLCEPTDPRRDWTEVMLCRWALEAGKPILGICRGMQVINVAAGGTLYQDLGVQYVQAIKHDYFSRTGGYARDLLAHEVRVTTLSSLGRLLAEEQVRVNSMHHQGLNRLAGGLAATAFAPDGLIEGIEATDGRFLIGVQWHPEELIDHSPAMCQLFASFTAASGETGGRSNHRGRAAGPR